MFDISIEMPVKNIVRHEKSQQAGTCYNKNDVINVVQMLSRDVVN